MDEFSSGVPDDKWAKWLLGARHGGNAAYLQVVQSTVGRIRDRVLDNARLQPGMTLADIGTGDGLIAFGAIARVGSSLRVILHDISIPLLRRAEERAGERNVRAQCSFVKGSAENLGALSDGTVDVVTTRAVLAYVANKPAAFREFHRVLKSGGRISIAEPIFHDQASDAIELTKHIRFRKAPDESDFLQLVQIWKAEQFPSTEEEARISPLANFTERDLVRFAGEAGFVNTHLELHIDVRPSSVTTWDVFLDTSPHPWAPPLREIFARRFSERERKLFENVLRPRVEAFETVENDVLAYLTAEKQVSPGI